MAARPEVDYLLIGGGLAAANCARWLREEGAEGSILLVGRELDPPYNRPPLSKGYLRGEESKDDVLFRPDEWWGEQDIELLTRTSVMKLDAGERVATLSNKEEVRFGKALLATGANVRRLRAGRRRARGHPLPARARQLRRDPRRGAEKAERVVLIGGSYIGCEVAASLTSAHGVKCSIVMLEDDLARAPLRRRGRRLLPARARGARGGGARRRRAGALRGPGGRVGRVVTDGGLELDCDMVVIGAGVMPDVMLARGAGLELGRPAGVRLLVAARDLGARHLRRRRHLRVRQRRPRPPIRVEHWDVAFNHGKTAALNMLGRDVPHDTFPTSSPTWPTGPRWSTSARARASR